MIRARQRSRGRRVETGISIGDYYTLGKESGLFAWLFGDDQDASAASAAQLLALNAELTRQRNQTVYVAIGVGVGAFILGRYL